MGEVIDLDQARREAWVRKVREMRELGSVAVFGAIGEQDAVVLQFPAPDQTPPQGAA